MWHWRLKWCESKWLIHCTSNSNFKRAKLVVFHYMTPLKCLSLQQKTCSSSHFSQWMFVCLTMLRLLGIYSCVIVYLPACIPQCNWRWQSFLSWLEEASGQSLQCCWLPVPQAEQGLLGCLHQRMCGHSNMWKAELYTPHLYSSLFLFTLYFNWCRWGGSAMFIYSYTGVDASILRHQITDLQHYITWFPKVEQTQHTESYFRKLFSEITIKWQNYHFKNL